MANLPNTIREWLDAIPVSEVVQELDQEGRTILLRPKFMSPRLRWLQRFMHKPHFRVKLDEVGTCLWKHMDGQRNGAQLSQILREHFHERVEPAEERTAAFLRQLAQGAFIRLEKQPLTPDP
jgi:hypothetical protein